MEEEDQIPLPVYTVEHFCKLNRSVCMQDRKKYVLDSVTGQHSSFC